MEFNDDIKVNKHGLDIGILDSCHFMAKQLAVTGDSTMILSTEDMTTEELMEYLNITSSAEFDQFDEDFLWQMYRKEDAYIHYFLNNDGGFPAEIEFHICISCNKTIILNLTDDTDQEVYEVLDSVAKIEAYFLVNKTRPIKYLDFPS